MAARSLVGRHRAHRRDGAALARSHTHSLAAHCPRPPVIILGTARSGTTMLADLLRRMGLFVGTRTAGEYLEAEYFRKANDTIIKHAHGYWDHPDAMHYLLRDHAAVERIARCLKTDLHSCRFAAYTGWTRYLRHGGLCGMDMPWGWKDPPTLFTLPMWLCVFPDARLVYIHRNGVDVAASLRTMERKVIARREHRAAGMAAALRGRTALQRFGFKGAARCLYLDGGFTLWEQYVAQARRMLDSVDNPRLILRYEDVLADPRAYIEKMVEFCRLPPADDRTLTAAAACVDGTRASAFVHDRETAAFYETVRHSPWMVREGYD